MAFRARECAIIQNSHSTSSINTILNLNGQSVYQTINEFVFSHPVSLACDMTYSFWINLLLTKNPIYCNIKTELWSSCQKQCWLQFGNSDSSYTINNMYTYCIIHQCLYWRLVRHVVENFDLYISSYETIFDLPGKWVVHAFPPCPWVSDSPRNHKLSSF